MAIEGTKISALPVLESDQVTDMVVLSYLEDIPKKNFKVPYTNIKERISEDIIDQHYEPESKNAQSGFAVAEAIEQLDLEARFAEKADITFVNQVENTINEKLDTKTDKTTTEALQTELESLDARMESAEDTLFAHAEELEKKATKDELQETKEEIEETVKEMTDELQKEVNERIGSMEVEVQEKATQKELENAKSELSKDIQDLKQDIIDGVIGSDIDEEKLNEILADYIKREEHENDITGLRDEDEILHLLHDENVAALETKASKDDISEIYEEIEKLKQEGIELDDYVSSGSSNAVTSSGIYNFVTGQGFLTEQDIESLKPFEPVETETSDGNIDKSAYWFILDKKYFGKGYLQGIRIKTGIQPEIEDSSDDYTNYVSLAVCKAERDSSGRVISFIPLGYSNSYLELIDNGWMSFDFNNVAINGNDDVAIVFCESPYDSRIGEPDAKLFSVVVKSSVVSGESSIIYADGGEEKFVVQTQISLNRPLSSGSISQEVIEQITETVKEAIEPDIKKTVSDSLLEIETRVAANSTAIQKIPKFVILDSEGELPDVQEKDTIYLVFEP